MTVRYRLASVVRWLFHRKRAEQQLDDELQGFIEMSSADKMRDGVPPAQARRSAILELGGIEQAKERVRTHRHGALIDDVGRDVRYAFRMIAKHPGFTLVVVLKLALGIGANTAIFTLIDALMLRWLPVRNPQELVQLKFTSSDAKRGIGHLRSLGGSVYFIEGGSPRLVHALLGANDSGMRARTQLFFLGRGTSRGTWR